MKLWVDDIRKEPEGWIRARSVTEAIRILDTFEIIHDTANSVGASKMAEILKRFCPTIRLSKPCNRFEETDT